ncbi:MAG: hypothetical protein KJ060_16125 [Candidatus Hydrogenedentes bacterium]|nr:hypothetical protein [Candidatus Hydrogenedentota bacterium]
MLPLAFLVLVGCQTKAQQQLYFAATDLDDSDPRLKFYRITIKGKSRNMNSHLETGFYDASAVRGLYGEVSDAGKPAPDTGTYRLVRQNDGWELAGNNTLFTIFYGTDANALAQAVNNFATSESAGLRMGQLLGAAVMGDKYLDAQEVEERILEEESKATAIQTMMDRFAAKGTKDRGAMLHFYARTAAMELGIPDTQVPPATDVPGLHKFLQDAMVNLMKKNGEEGQS